MLSEADPVRPVRVCPNREMGRPRTLESTVKVGEDRKSIRKSIEIHKNAFW